MNDDYQYGHPQKCDDYDDYDDISVKEWLIIFLITIIPFVGFVMLIIWAISAVNTSKKTYAQAALIFVPLQVILTALANY